MTLYAGHVEARYDGTLHFQSLYKEIHEWILENDYCETDKEWDFPETLYHDSRSQPLGSEVLIWFRPTYVPEDNPFYRYILRINIHAQKLKNNDIMQDNKKVQVQWAEFRVVIEAFLESDYEKRWQKSWFLKHFYEFFLKRIIWKDFEKRKHAVLHDAYRLQRRIKEFFGTAQATYPKKSFRPKHGLAEVHPY